MIRDEVLSAFSGSSCVVTGGTGMIGREVVRLLCEAGAHVKSVSLDQIDVHPKAENVYADLTDFGKVKDITSGADYVFHVAGIKGSVEMTKSKPASFLVPLLMMNTNVLEAARINKARKAVYTSTIGAYAAAEVFKEEDYDESEPPMDHYPGWAKRIAEMQVQTYRIQYDMDNFAIVRPCNVYGPGDSFKPESAMVVPSLLMRIFRGEDPVTIWGDGSAIRDFAYATDVAEGVILGLYHGTRDSFVNLASGEGHSIKYLVDCLHNFIKFDHAWDTTKPSGFPRRVMDVERARAWIDYNPTTSLQDGLEKTWKWLQTNADEHVHRKNYFSE